MKKDIILDALVAAVFCAVMTTVVTYIQGVEAVPGDFGAFLVSSIVNGVINGIISAIAVTIVMYKKYGAVTSK